MEAENLAASQGSRVLAWIIDVIPALVLGIVVGWVPILGGIVLVAYWLLRDITSASLGKLALGLRVVAKNGTPAEQGARVLRNLPLAIGPAFMIIPLAGLALGPVIALIVNFIEGVFVLAQGERLGDKIAGTMVVRR